MRTLPAIIAFQVLTVLAVGTSLGLADEADVMGEVDRLFAAGRTWEATELLHTAAGQGLSAAQAELGGLYFAGIHVPQDYALAEKYLRGAVVADATPAHKRDLGCVLYHRGGDDRAQESITLTEQAAAAGDILALINESRLHRLGIGRPANLSFGNHKLERALSRIHEFPERDTEESAFLRSHVSHILDSGVCGPPDPSGAFLARAFPMRYRPWPPAGRPHANPLFLYLNTP